ncbi:MAG: uL22 family ribosomal protein [Patescibacteria group bacterium]
MKQRLSIKKRYIKITPAKMKIVGRELKGLSIEKALEKLSLVQRASAKVFKKMLIEAKNNFQEKNINSENLIVKAVRADMGPSLKRHIPRSRGRVSPLKKVSSHVIVEFEAQKLKAKIKTKAKDSKLKLTKKSK